MLFRALLPDAVLIAEMAPADAHPAQLPLAEQSLIERAVESRRLEFAAGRELARALLRRTGVETEALLRDKDRVPAWPQAVVGSITHCRSLCAVALAPRAVSAGIGIDVEPAQPLDEGLNAHILRPAEHARVDALPSALRPLGGILVFSIKEAVYKAIYPERRIFLRFPAGRDRVRRRRWIRRRGAGAGSEPAGPYVHPRSLSGGGWSYRQRGGVAADGVASNDIHRPGKPWIH